MDEDGVRKRPAVISVICWLGFIGAAFSVVNLLTAVVGPGRSLFHAYFAVVLACNVAAFVGMWRMRRWGVVLYALTAVVNGSLLWQVWRYPLYGILIGTVLSAVVVLVGVSQFSKMD